MEKAEALSLVESLSMSDFQRAHLKAEIEAGKAVLIDDVVPSAIYPQGIDGSKGDVTLVSSKCKMDDFNGAKNLTLVIGSVDVLNTAATNNFAIISGKVRVRYNVLTNSRDSSISADEVYLDTALDRSENCYIFADRIEVPSNFPRDGHGHIGVEARGGAVVVEETNCWKLNGLDAVTIIAARYPKETKSGRTIRGVTKYTGKDWKSFRKHIEEARSQGKLGALRAFKVERAALGSEQEFDEAIEELDKVWKEVEGNFWKYRGLAEKINLPDIYRNKNSERVRFLRNLPKEAQNVLKERCGLTDDNARIVYELDHLKEFIDAIETGLQSRVMRIIEKKDPDRNKFIETFSDPKRIEGVHADCIRENGFAPTYRAFNRNYSIAISESGAEADESANEVLYRQGLEIVYGIRSGRISLNPEIDEGPYSEVNPNSYTNRIKEMKRRLKESKGEDHEAKSELVRIQKEVAAEKGKKSEDLKNRLKPSYTPEELKEELSQLSQHYLSGKPADQARKISESIVVREGELTSNTMEVSVWDKNLQTMPTYEEYGCCAFLGGGRSSLLDYMRQPGVQLLSVKVGDKTAMAIASIGADVSKRKVLMVDSVESRSHMFARKDVSAALAKAIGDYARESGFDRVLYNTTPGNSAPKEFVQSIYGLGKKTAETVLFPKVYLEQKQEFLEIPLSK